MKIDVSKPLRTHQLAAVFDVHERTINNWRRAGRIPYMRANRVILYDYKAVLEAINHPQGIEVTE